MELAPDIRWRRSRRGLVIGGFGEAALLEHPRASELPDLLADSPDAAELARRMGEPRPVELVAEMVEAGILVDTDADTDPADTDTPPERSVVLTRSGMEFPGIARPARWIHRRLGPLWLSLPGRVLLGLVVAGGVVSMLLGRPAGPTVSAHPWADALIGFAVATLFSCLHELAHAVALVHYDRRPRRAGFGFYWGGISFYVDSTEALTLPRRARVTQALVGLGVDAVTTSLLALTAQLGAHLGAPVIVWTVAWRVAVLATLALAINLLPILQVDGHWALADALDEPDLALRARAALGTLLSPRRRTAWRPRPARWLAAYGAVSTIGGLAMLAVSVVVWWSAAGDLVRALFTGNPAEIVIGVVVAGPFAAGLVVSALGLLLELAAPDSSGVDAPV